MIAMIASRRHHLRRACACALVLTVGAAACSSSTSPKADQASQATTSAPVPGDAAEPTVVSSTTEPEPEDPNEYFLTEADVGSPVNDMGGDPGFGTMFDRDGYRDVILSHGSLQRWDDPANNVSAYDPYVLLDEGPTVAEDLADIRFGDREVLGCWTADPPRVELSGVVTFEDGTLQKLDRYASEDEAAAVLQAAVDGTGLVSGWESLRYWYSYDQNTDQIRTDRCRVPEIEDPTPCASHPDCWVRHWDATGQEVLVAQVGPWIVQLSGPAPAERLLDGATQRLAG